MNINNKQELETLILANNNLIYALAHRFNYNDSKEDLYQVGVIGLIKAYRNFDDKRGCKFSTYAYPYIVGEMKKFRRENYGLKVSRDLIYLYGRIEKARNIISQKLRREPTTLEVANFLELPEAKVIRALQVNRYIKSLEEPILEDGKELMVSDVISDPVKVDKLALISLKEELESLEESELELFKARYLEARTQMETAKLMGRTQVQISRAEQKILTKLRNNIYY